MNVPEREENGNPGASVRLPRQIQDLPVRRSQNQVLFSRDYPVRVAEKKPNQKSDPQTDRPEQHQTHDPQQTGDHQQGDQEDKGIGSDLHGGNPDVPTPDII